MDQFSHFIDSNGQEPHHSQHQSVFVLTNFFIAGISGVASVGFGKLASALYLPYKDSWSDVGHAALNVATLPLVGACAAASVACFGLAINQLKEHTKSLDI